MTTKTFSACFSLLLVGLAGNASAVTTYDLTARPGPNSATINGAIFTTSSSGPTGSGIFDPFIRQQSPGNNDTSAGYNANQPGGVSVMPDVNDPFTKDVQLGQLSIVNNDYYLFRLDMNEPSGGTKPLLSIDKLQIYTRSTAITDASSLALLQAGATLRYDLDAGGDTEIKLDYDLGGGGSGKDDMWAYIPTSAFAGLGAGDYLYFYTEFGRTSSEDSGYEEWAFDAGSSTPPSDTPGVPDGGTSLLLLGLSLASLGGLRRLV